MADDAFRLDGLNALVIGGTSGIGKAIAEGYLRAGARVAIAGRDKAKLEGALGQLRACGDARETLGSIDVLVNSQGTLTLKPAEEYTAEDWDRIIDTNLRSVFFACTE